MKDLKGVRSGPVRSDPVRSGPVGSGRRYLLSSRVSINITVHITFYGTDDGDGWHNGKQQNGDGRQDDGDGRHNDGKS